MPSAAKMIDRKSIGHPLLLQLTDNVFCLAFCISLGVLRKADCLVCSLNGLVGEGAELADILLNLALIPGDFPIRAGMCAGKLVAREADWCGWTVIAAGRIGERNVPAWRRTKRKCR